MNREWKVSLAVRFVLTLLLVVLSGLVILCLTTLAFAWLLDAVSPGWSEPPLSLFVPLGAAALLTPLIEIIILGVLTYRRALFAEFFLILICFVYVLAVAPELIVRPLAEKYFSHWYPVWIATPSDYPLLVITPGNQTNSYSAHVIHWSELADFRKRNPDASFLVPKGQKYGALREQLPSFSRRWLLAHPGPPPSQAAYFWFSDLPNGRQDFYVSLTPPLIESRYEAEATRIYPAYERTIQTYFAYQKGSWILVIALDIGALAFYLSRRWKKPKLVRVL
jgi:hypothetical protein